MIALAAALVAVFVGGVAVGVLGLSTFLAYVYKTAPDEFRDMIAEQYEISRD